MPKDYAVGYGKPPPGRRFSKGQSGNPTGRIKGARNLKTDLLEELQQEITVTSRGRKKKVTKQRALIAGLAARALQGDVRQQTLLINLMLRVLDPTAAILSERDIGVDDLKVIEAFMKRQTAKAENQGG